MRGGRGWFRVRLRLTMGAQVAPPFSMFCFSSLRSICVSRSAKRSCLRRLRWTGLGVMGDSTKVVDGRCNDHFKSQVTQKCNKFIDLQCDALKQIKI